MHCHNLLFAVGIAVSAPIPAMAQGLEIGGAQIELGAPEDSVLTALEDWPGMALRKVCAEAEVDCHDWLVMRGDQPPYDGTFGVVQFRRGAVTRASRNWEPKEQDSQVSVVRAVVSALRSAGAGEVCMIVDESIDNPDYRSTGVNVRCGNRGVSVSTNEYQGRDSFAVTEYVQE